MKKIKETLKRTAITIAVIIALACIQDEIAGYLAILSLLITGLCVIAERSKS